MWRVPKPLVPGDTIAVVAPAKYVHQEGVAAGIARIEQRGYRVRVESHVNMRSGLFSAPDHLRAADLLAAWHSPAAAVFCAQGGYGSQRLLPLIDWAALTQTPKWLVGYSDITALHRACNQQGLVTVHGPIVRQLGRTSDGGYGLDTLFALLEGAPEGQVQAKGGTLQRIVGGRAEGRLLGGNLSLLCATLGTPYEIDTRDAILMFEDVEEEPYRLDRMLSQLEMAGKLAAAKGFAVGTFADCGPSDWAPDVTAYDVVASYLVRLGKPALFGLPIGHDTYNTAVLLGSWAALDADQGCLTYKGLEQEGDK